MKKMDIDQLIDKHVRGTINEEEAKLLQGEIERNPALQSDIDLRKDLVKSIQYMEQDPLKAMLDKIHQEEVTNGSNKRQNTWLKYLVLALLLTLTGLGYILLNKTSTTKVEGRQYFAQNYSAYTPSIGERGAEEDDKAIFIAYYQEMRYRDALKLIENSDRALSSEELLLAGISAIETNELDKAIRFFDSIITKEDYFFTDHANWYKALSLLKQNKIEAALPVLQTLTKDANQDHYQEAVKLVNELQ